MDRDSGDTLSLNVAPGSAIIVTQNLDQAGGQATLIELFGGLALLALNYTAGVGPSTIRANAILQFPGPTTGSVRCGATFDNTVLQELFLNLTVAGATVPSAIPVVPVGVFDFDWDAEFRTITSSKLGKVDGYKATDDLQFAVIPRRAGTLISTGITSLKFTLRPQGKFNCAPLLQVTLASPSLTGSSPNQYYALNFSLAQKPIIDYFTQADDLALGGNTTGPNPAQLAVSAEFEIIESTGKVSTSDTVNFLIFQSLTSPSPA